MSTEVVSFLRVFRLATLIAWADYRAILTWRSWIFGTVVRVATQIIFYASIGLLLESRAEVRFLLIGNSVSIATSITMVVVATTTSERTGGTLPLLAASPSRVFPAFLGRSVQWVPDALVTSFLGFVVAVVAFRISLPMPRALWALPVVVLTLVGTYGFGAFVGGFVLKHPGARHTVSNLGMASMAILCGVNVPVDFFPLPMRWLAQVLPLTHGLQAVRGLLALTSTGSVLGPVLWCAVTGLGWLLLAAFRFEAFVEAGRRNGSIDYAA
jgi:ABC-2 type transport system permease protein